MKDIKCIVGIAAAILLIGETFLTEVCAADTSKTNVTVEVLIFSGRRNPTWQLQDTKALEKLKPRLKELPEAFDTEPAEWSRLGFRGFRIRGGESLGLPDDICVYRGVMKTGHGKAAKYLKDLTRLEQSLIDESRKQPLQGAVKDAIAEYENARKGSQ